MPGPVMTDLDLIDDELFAGDYWPLLAESPTVRLGYPDPPTVRLWPTDTTYAPDENAAEIVALIGLAVLIVVTVATVTVVLWLWV